MQPKIVGGTHINLGLTTTNKKCKKIWRLILHHAAETRSSWTTTTQLPKLHTIDHHRVLWKRSKGL